MRTVSDQCALSYTADFAEKDTSVSCLLTDGEQAIFLFNSVSLSAKSLFYTERRDIYYENYF